MATRRGVILACFWFACCGSAASPAGETADADAVAQADLTVAVDSASATDAAANDAAPGSDADTAQAPVDAGASDGASVACGSAATVPGTTTIPISFGGKSREYILHVPPGYTGQTPMPLVVNFHGLTMTDVGEETFTGMDAKADSAGFLLAYPNGLDESFNAGLCCGLSGTNQVDDVGFTRALVADIQKRACVDAKRIYATGMSNGGFMSQRLGCDAADVFAAIAPVSGLLAVVSCSPSRPMPVIEFHGTADTIVGYNSVPSVDATFKGWAQRDGCTDTPAETFHNGTVSCVTYAKCAGGVKVTQCTLAGEGHCWPGQAQCPYGASDMDLNANDAIWSFLQGFAMP